MALLLLNIFYSYCITQTFKSSLTAFKKRCQMFVVINVTAVPNVNIFL